MENLKSDDSIHKECLMKEAWATLKQYQRDRSKARVLETSHLEKNIQTFIGAQTKINLQLTESITDLVHRVIGNTKNGLTTTVKLNQQESISENKRLEESARAESRRLDAKLDRIWWGIAVIVIALVGNIFFMIFRDP